MFADSSSDGRLEFLEPLRVVVTQRLGHYLRLGAGCPPRLAEAMEYSLLAGGKRLRPMLVLLAAKACGGGVEAALPAACAVEMIHTYSLIHDDLPAMDDDDLRRGRPTNHKVFGEATAILAGDALLTLAFEVLARDIKPPAVAARCCAALAEAAGATGLVGGQVDDLAAAGAGVAGSKRSVTPVVSSRATAPRGQPFGVTPPPVAQDNGHAALPPAFAVGSARSLGELEAIHARKTAALFRASLKLGGLVAGADERRLALLDAFGETFGLAFQITDDLLDACGVEAHVGKRVGKDAAQGKLTYPGVVGVEDSVCRARQLAERAAGLARSLDAPDLEALALFVVERGH